MTTYSLRSGGKVVPVLPTSPVSATAGDRVVVRGDMRKGRLVGSITRGANAAIGPIIGPIFDGPRKVAVLLVSFAGDPAVPWSPEETREKVFTGTASTDVFFQEESHGVISLVGKADPDEGDVFGWFALDASGSGCSAFTWASQAAALASESGISLAGYHHIVYAFTHRSGCVWNGMATGAGNTGSVYLNGNVGVRTIAHEFGHNFGLGHAGSWTCTRNGAPVQISNSCSTSEYGDVFDSMGNVAARHNNGWNLAKLGILSAANVTSVTEDGTYALKSAFSLTPVPMILRVPRITDQGGNVMSWYYLEIRQAGGVFENVPDASTKGVSIRAAASGSSPETLLLDSNPATPSFTDAPLQVGNTFYDGRVRIKTLTAGGGAASVSVELNAVDVEPPTAPANVSASHDAAGVKLQWSASTDEIGVFRYVVFRDGAEIGTSPTVAFTDANATVGQHAYTVYAEDEAGNRSAGSVPIVFDVEDGAARVKPVLRVQRRANGTFLVEVDASRNPGAARVSLWLGGELLRSKEGSILRFIWKPRVTRCARLYRFSARAYEPTAAGHAIETTRVRHIRFPKPAGKCHDRKSASRA